MISLGFDASTSTVGWAFTEDGKILDCGFIDISKIKGNREKAWEVINQIKSNPLTEKAGVVNLEGSLSGFSGPSSRTVVVQLARWNAIFEYVLQDYFKVPTHLVNVSTARKQIFGKARVKGMKPKEYVKIMVDKSYDMSKWTINNSRGDADKRMEDVRDALVISLYKKNV